MQTLFLYISKSNSRTVCGCMLRRVPPVFFIFIVAIIILTLTACDKNPSQVNYQKAYDLYQKGQYKESLPLFEEAVANNPKNLDYHLRYGNALEESGQIDRAITEYEKILSEKSDHILALVSLANAHRRAGDLEIAVITMRKAISFKKKDPWMLDNFGNILEQAGELEEAYKQYELAVNFEPNDPEYRTDLANICLKLKKDPCIVVNGKKIKTVEVYRDLREEALEQYQILDEQEKYSTSETDKARFKQEKEKYLKAHNFNSDMVGILEKE